MQRGGALDGRAALMLQPAAAWHTEEDETVALANLPADLATGKIARPGIRRRHTIVCMDVDVRIAGIDLVDERRQRLHRRASRSGSPR